MSSQIFAAILGIDSFRELAQAMVTGIITGAAYGLLGAGLALILGVTGRFHFAVGSTYMVTAYLAAVATGIWGLPLIPAVIVGLAVATVFALAIEGVVYNPLAKRAGDGGLLPVFVASLGIVIITENLVRVVWGNNTRNLEGFPSHTYNLGNVTFTLLDLTLVIVTLVLLGGLSLLLARTVLGEQIRAVRGNPLMAQAVGVSVRRIFYLVFAIGTLVVGVAAIFSAMKFAVIPSMGNEPIFYAFVVAFVAGSHRPPIVVGLVGIAIGLAESVSTIWVSDNISALVVFGLLFAILAARSVPQGIRQLSGALSKANRRTLERSAQTRA
ncbi:MAG TPA: branched-chain amino acid ABC transporter permease [Solirubrobacterales bacterium]|nr:branched-chain amino acid ABC transporter permease [Solirubrobacterales bacterium]